MRENTRSKSFKFSANVLSMTMMSSRYTRLLVPWRPLRTVLKGGRCISKGKGHDFEFKKPFSCAKSSFCRSSTCQSPLVRSRVENSCVSANVSRYLSIRISGYTSFRVTSFSLCSPRKNVEIHLSLLLIQSVKPKGYWMAESRHPVTFHQEAS